MGREAPKSKAKITNTRAAAAALVGWNSGFGGGRKDVVSNRFHVEELMKSTHDEGAQVEREEGEKRAEKQRDDFISPRLLF